MSCANLLKEFVHIDKWVQSQLQAKISQDYIATTQFESVRNKIRKLKHVTYGEGADLISAIAENKSFGWNDQHVKDLTMEVNEHVKVGADQDSSEKLSRMSQECPTFELYLLDKEMTQVCDTNLSDTCRTNVIKKAAKRCGIFLPSEKPER